MRNVWDYVSKENQNTYFMLNKFSPKSCRLEYNVEKYGGVRHATGSNIVRYMRFVRWITKAADTRSEYVIFFPPRHNSP